MSKSIDLGVDEEKNMMVTTSQPSPDGQEAIQYVHQEPGEAANTCQGRIIGSFESFSFQMTIKRKDGPRKYDQLVERTSPPSDFHIPVLTNSEKRPTGRPRGSGKWKLLASLGGCFAETAGGNFTPNVLVVQPGLDIVSTILEISQNGNNEAVCIFSATGAVSSVVLRQPGSSVGFLHYQGMFEILTLKGSFTYEETIRNHGKNGILSVSLAKPDGVVFGGGIVGPLIAHCPVQVVVGSFKQNVRKELKKVRVREASESSTAAVNGKIEPDVQNDVDFVIAENTTSRTPASPEMDLPANSIVAVDDQDHDLMVSVDPEDKDKFEFPDHIDTVSIHHR